MAGLSYCSSWVMFQDPGLSSFKSGRYFVGLPSLGKTASAEVQLQVWVREKQQGTTDQETVEEGTGCQEVTTYWYNGLERA